MYDGNAGSLVHHEEGFSLTYLSAEGQNLIAGFNCITGCSGKVLVYDQNLNAREPANNCVSFPTFAVEDETGNIWFADRASTFRVESGGSGACEQISINSYPSSLVYDITVANGQVWVATGGLDNNFSALFRTEGFSSLIDGEWTQYNLFNQPAPVSYTHLTLPTIYSV